MEQQFPPSSPLLAAPEQHDPFASPLRNKSTFQKNAFANRGRETYPTPNPSSTLGRSSSPQRLEDEVFETPLKAERLPVSTPQKVSINKDFNILNPHASVLRVPLVQSPLTIGRSSRSCDLHLNQNGKVNKTISRVHVQIVHSDASMALTCIGHNGFGIIIPRVCHVNKTPDSTPSSPVYELRETGKPLAAKNISKTIHLDYQHTEFYVARGETVKMPRFPNVLVQIASSVLLINPDDCDEDVTDDEAPEHKFEAKPEHKSEAKHANQSMLKNDNNNMPHNTSHFETPLVSAVSAPQTPVKSRPSDNFAENPEITPSKNLRENTRKPLASRTNLPEERPAKKQKIDRPADGSRARSEEPLKKTKSEKAVHDADGKLIIDHESIKGIKNKSEIENILINHLAFSRLSSTPASVLNTISVAVSEISLPQLRAILHDIQCIGVIYRSGKDAAGKPLEEEYYYMPEHDQDPERNQLVSSIKGAGGLRACRRTHKQYYWKKPAPIKK